MDEKSIQTLELLSSHELKIAELYKYYAFHLPDYQAFWEHISQEEVFHSNWIKSLVSVAQKHPFSIDKLRFDSYLIQNSINFLNGLIVADETIQISPAKAFQTAYKYEMSMLENDFFEVVSGDPPELSNILTKLKEETIKHSQELKDKMEEIKNI